MNRIPLSVGLGLLSIFVFLFGAEPFEKKNEILAIASGSIVLAIYLGVCAYWMLHNTDAGAPMARQIAIALLLPLVAEAIVVLIFERSNTFLSQAIPMLFAGSIGCVIGIWQATRHPQIMPPHAR